MTGIDQFNYPMFNKVSQELRDSGAQVINPAEFFGGKGDRTYQEYMRESIRTILFATEVILLPDWRTSNGSRLEVDIATQLGLKISEYDTHL